MPTTHTASTSLNATVTNSDYKWLSSTLKKSQLGPQYRPVFKCKVLDDQVEPLNILSGTGWPKNGKAVTSPDGYILMVGNDGSGNLKFYKLADASQTLPSGTTLTSSYDSSLNASIACSDWINGSYVIDVYYYTLTDGLSHKRSVDGGNTWTISYSLNATNDTGANKYVAAGKPVYNPALGVTTAIVFYIKGNQGTSSSYYRIFYQQWTQHNGAGGLSFNAETAWSRAVDSQDWTMHSLDVLYYHGSYYVVFSGFHNWLETPSGNNNYNIYITQIDRVTSSSASDSWQLVKGLLVASSPQSSNLNQFTYPQLSFDGTTFFLIYKAVVVEGTQTASTGSDQVSSITNQYYYSSQSLDLANFSYPSILISADASTYYENTVAVSLVPQFSNSFYYLLGNAQTTSPTIWQYQKNNILADLTNDVLDYQVQEMAGSAFNITVHVGNANNKWVGNSPSGSGASAIAANKKVIIEQGYVTSTGSEYAPRNVFFIDNITLNTTSSDNSFNLTGRDSQKRLKLLTTKFNFLVDGIDTYTDLFDGTTLNNWQQNPGPWQEINGTMQATEGGFESIVTLSTGVDSTAESALFFGVFDTNNSNGDYFSVYSMFQDSNNFVRIRFLNISGTSLGVLVEVSIAGSLTVVSSVSTPFTFGDDLPIFIRKYDYYTYDVLIGQQQVGGNAYTDTALDPNATHPPIPVLTGIEIDSVFTSTAFVVNGSPSIGINFNSPGGYFYAFKYLQFGNSLSIQEAVEYICGLSGMQSFNRKYSFTDNTYARQNYFGNYSVAKGTMVIPSGQLVINLVSTIANGEMNFMAKTVASQDNLSSSVRFCFRINPGALSYYYFDINKYPSGPLVASLYLVINNGTPVLLASSSMDPYTSSDPTNPVPLDITQWHNYRVVLIDQFFYLFIDGRLYMIWHDNNVTDNGINFSEGFWGFIADNNTTLYLKNFNALTMWNQISNIVFSPGDDADSLMDNVIETAYGWLYTDQLGRTVITNLNPNDASTYTYQNIMYQLQDQKSNTQPVNECVVTGTGVSATFKDTSLISLMGFIVSMSVIDYTIITYQDALVRAEQELINANRFNNQNNPQAPMNVGAEVLDMITITDLGGNSTGLNGEFRVYNETFSNAGSNGQYLIEVETGTP